jgi:hypothetical protein
LDSTNQISHTFTGWTIKQNHPFKINERALFQPEHDLEIAAMSHGSGILENPSAILAGFIQQNIHNNTLEAAIRLGFEQTKNYLSAKNPSIGGKTFSLVL